ncbi:tonB-system energizer ExbB [uncultured Stenotrophomonas sp.]|uniref:tonB-system energizer ExbB n=1 Tax=uncultured Stenotrophomonas sp. TaxID=165438 RepID=UPI0025CE4C9F|nr:tonB-system energizer ExbB [uncultured Stenotrophomonas sp.]
MTTNLPSNLSPWQMFLHADWVVQTVMVGLAIASLATWTVLLAKHRQLRREAQRMQTARGALAAADTLPTALATSGRESAIASALLAEAQDELQRSPSVGSTNGIKERVGSRLQRIELAHARQLRGGTGLLATIGATAPFVGLFGTVWGIMNSFVGIAQANTTNLAVVAPGIAEALLATALGLVAAIPAVVIYNHLSRQLAALRGDSGDLSACVQQLVSRDLDRRAFPSSGAP